jgi:hypothetical protein
VNGRYANEISGYGPNLRVSRHAFEQSPSALFWRLRQCFETLLVQSGKPAA